MMETLVLGIGNPLLGDDGFGVEVIRRLREQADLPDAELLDGGAVGLYLLPHLEGRSRILVVDAINFGGQPGQVVRLQASEIPARLALKLSEHQVTFHEVLALMELMKIKPREFIFIGVQPRSNGWGESLSPEVAAAIPGVIEQVKSQIQIWRCAAHAVH